MSNRRGGPLRWLNEALARVLRVLLALAIAVLVVPVSLQIFSRYTALIPAYIWTEEMARFLFVWAIMIGATLAVRERAHFVVDLWPPLPPRTAALLDLASDIAVAAVAVVFLVAGWWFTESAFHRISELAELPLWLIHIAWPLAGLAWLLFLAERVNESLRVLRGGGR
ncbi:MAG: TRAP transporter small permease subunit [Geminicoccaceae bacterium]|nr:TRAP transporter small permease subunit [Geminicoccaceae bacterium]MDW8341385.1 TRAP transporter small permease subunit [Geminicoccaceae bacterium]